MTLFNPVLFIVTAAFKIYMNSGYELMRILSGFYFCCYFPLIEWFVGFLKLVYVWFVVCVWCCYCFQSFCGFFADENGNILQMHKGVTLRIIEASKSHFS